MSIIQTMLEALGGSIVCTGIGSEESDMARRATAEVARDYPGQSARFIGNSTARVRPRRSPSMRASSEPSPSSR